MAVDLLDYLIRVSGAAAAGAEVKGLRDEFVELGDAAGKAGDESAASSLKLSKGFAAIGKVGLGLGVVLAGTAIKAVEMSNTFQTEMLKIRTEGGATSKEFVHMRAAVLNLASSGASMGQGPTSLAQGLYHLESMGLRGRKAILGLKLASEEAAISGASLEDTTTSLGGALFIATKGTNGLKGVMGSLNAIAGAGNMRFQDLNEALGTGLLGAAKLAHLSLQETGAALDVLTDSGYKASSAGAQLATALHYLYAPGLKGANALDSIGLSGKKLAADLRKPQGLLSALRDLRTHIAAHHADSQQVLGDILPGGRGRVLANLYQLQGRLAPKYRQVTGTENTFGQHVIEQGQNPATKLAEANAKVQASMVRLGDVATKYLTPALIWVENAASKVINALTLLPGIIGKVIGVFKSGVSGGMHSSFFGAVAKDVAGLEHSISSLWKAAQPALQKIGAAAKSAFNGQFVSSLLTIGKDLLWIATVVGKTVLGTFQAALPAIVEVFSGGFQVISGIVKFVASLLTLHLGRALTDLEGIAGGAIKVVIGIFRMLLAPTKYVIDWIITELTKPFHFLESLPGKIASVAKGMWDGLKVGLIDVVNWIIGAINHVIRAINTGDAITVFGHRIGAPEISQIGTITLNTSSNAARAKRSSPGLPPILAAPKHAQGHNHVVHEHINVVMDSKVLAQATRKHLRAAQMGAVS